MSKFIIMPLLVISFLAIDTMAILAQQTIPLYNHYQTTPEPINMSYGLTDEGVKAYSLLRRQWVGFEGAPSTGYIGVTLPLHQIRSAASFDIVYDELGPEKSVDASAYFGTKVRLGENDFLGTTIGLGIRNYRANYSRLAPEDYAFRTDINESVASVKLSVLYFRKDRYYIGLALPRFGHSKTDRLPYLETTYSMNAAAVIPLDNSFELKPATWWSVIQGERNMFNFSLEAYLNRTFGLGINYVNTKDIGYLASFYLAKFRIGYSYQMGQRSNGLTSLNNATHEFSIRYHLNKNSIL
ncbi:PorP/SprF family type IX secretion system membrane protein [Sphingobacterium sp. LRF_L2]|uniref:PorP/SprF family type IX secretion system membrane protein n=1 Tax=Sphingobacterium sp. LRF_L2 TaxID=3369421 RepID=UPI003F62BD6F